MFKIVLVTGQSMIPTLQSGERVLAWTPFAKRFFKRETIVTLSYFYIHLPADERVQPHFRTAIASVEHNSSELFVKRIIGLPGDTVRIPVSQLTPHTIATVNLQARRSGLDLVWRIPPDYVFVRGDGVQSSDSVTWGPIPLAQLQQIVLCRFPSFKRIS